MWFRAFPAQVGPQILSLESFDYFGTREYFSGQKKKRRRILILLAKLRWWGKVNFHCMLMILWWVYSLFLTTIEIHQVFTGNDAISLESRPLNYHVIIHVYSLRLQMYFRSSLTQILIKSIQKQIIEYDIKSHYPEEIQPPIK